MSELKFVISPEECDRLCNMYKVKTAKAYRDARHYIFHNGMDIWGTWDEAECVYRYTLSIDGVTMLKALMDRDEDPED